MMGRMTRVISVTTMLTMATGSVGCGYLLYPERRGQQSGRIDGATMVMDLLWLLPGIIPGVVALIVDFSSGAIYVRGRTALRLPHDGRVAVRLPHSSKPMLLEFRLVTSSHSILAHKSALIGPSIQDGQSVELEIGDSMRGSANGGGHAEEIFLEVRGKNGEAARLPTSIELAPAA